MKEKWKDLELKTRIAYVTALVAFCIGWALTIAGFCVPPLGMVSESVLWILGQALLYAASVFGIGLYVTGQMRGMRRNIAHFMMEERKRLEEGEEIEKNPEEDFEE